MWSERHVDSVKIPRILDRQCTLEFRLVTLTNTALRLLRQVLYCAEGKTLFALIFVPITSNSPDSDHL